ncbi:hypothetical protein [Streptomyces sp. NPDC058374]|uniref:hypothetical protein n=1 Tax=unclassified Streptomyces TaxID=2593676 RepID=UPI00365DCCFE
MRNRRTARAATLTVLMSGAALAAAGAAQADTGQPAQLNTPGASAQDTLQGLPVVGELANGLPTQAISNLVPGGLPTDQVLGNLPADALTGQLPTATDAVTGQLPTTANAVTDAASRALPGDAVGNTLPTDGLPTDALLGGLPIG